MTVPIRPVSPFVSRRHFLASTAVILGGLATGMMNAIAGQQPSNTSEDHSKTAFLLLAYVGCRISRERNARGDGIRVYGINLDGSS